MKGLSLIVAMDRNGLIGEGNTLPWHIPEDLTFFRETTLNSNVIMGRSTYESIGKALPNRNNIVLTTQLDYYAPECAVATNPDDVLDLVASSDCKSFVIGGAQVYKLFIPYANSLYITHIDGEFEGDTYFPSTSYEEWIVENIEIVKAAEYNLIIKKYIRNI
ncbi:dihydrofolate reductase [Paenibacillus medicaginis]|uniref:Dihydrofolate reductase n=1 Tax=Paenibacillus medicaginis TaxID=1470560 RepID=A0ABV5BUG3_9BACL